MSNTENSTKIMQTKRVLANQLMGLLESKSFKKITVHDICEGALISRSAFYHHFEDKYHLLRYCLEQELVQWAATRQEKTTEDFMLFTLDSILEKKKFFLQQPYIRNGSRIDRYFSINLPPVFRRAA